MNTKTLASAIIGFLLGGLVVSLAATVGPSEDASGSEMTMSEMNEELRDKTGEEYDAAFIARMIEHHQGALEMAELSEGRAQHEEVKQLSEEIIDAQQREIAQMRAWQRQWGYDAESDGEHAGH